MQQTGMLVQSWPIVLGCDASGIVVECGSADSRFQSVEGAPQGVFGSTRLGFQGYSTFQEYFLMDEHLAFKTPSIWGGNAAEKGATVGVGLLTACLGLISGTKIELAAKLCDDHSKWIVILGAAGAVGQFSVQIAKLCGFKVLASCSRENDEFVRSIGADATFDYKTPIESQIKEIERVTGGNFSKSYDCSAMAAETGMAALATSTDTEPKIFATTNDWIPIEEKEGIEICKVTLGQLGHSGTPLAEKVNRDVASFIPVLERFLESGEIKPLDYVLANRGEPGLKSVLKGLEEFNAKKSAVKKLVVRVSAD